MARTPRLSWNPLSDSIIEVTINLQSLSRIRSSKTLLARYHKPHTSIVARKNHHIHTRPCCVIILHKSRDGLQRSANCDHEFVFNLQRFCLQFSRYHELHAPISARNCHISHPTVPCNKPCIQIRLLTLLRLQLAMVIKLLCWMIMEGRHQGRSWMKMEGRHQERRLVYQSQSQRGYKTQLDF